MKLRDLTVLTAAAMLSAVTFQMTAFAQDAGEETVELVPLLPSYTFNADEFETEAERVEMKLAIEEANAHNASLSPQTGEITLNTAGAVIDMGENYYYLSPSDARKVLVDNWGNPYNPDVLGMIFERGTDAYSNDYAVALYFEDIGYVSDEDAATIDYEDLLKDMKKQTRQQADYRREEGYDGMELLGWGADPEYDALNHRVSWAQLLKFDNTEENTLNYNLRFLGRKGVLEFNYIAAEGALPVLKEAMPAMTDMATFNPGHRYTDFDPATDKVAAYGLAGLVAGGVVAKKLGFLGVLLLFLKKGWFIIVAAFVFGRKFIMGLFNKKPESPSA